MALSTAQCQQFNDALGRRPYDWDKRIAKDRKPHSYLYTGMYKTSPWKPFTGTTHLHEKVYVTMPNDPNFWPQFVADPCVGTPCTQSRQFVCHGVDQLRYDEYFREYQTPVFCLDQLNTIEEGIQKMAAIAEGYQRLPEGISSDFLRTLTLRKCGTNAQGGGLFISGLQDSSGNPVAIDIDDSMFTVSAGTGAGVSKNTLLLNLNKNGALTTLSLQTTALFAAAIGQLSMEYLANHQEDLAANGYHDRDWLVDGKFSITVDATTRRRLLVANPALTQMYSAADFAKGGAFYSFGITAGCGDWLFKEDKEQMRFRFRADLDGTAINGISGTNAVWIEQVQPFENVAATFGQKPVYSTMWKNAPLRLYHCYNRDAREVFVGDITSVNDEMKFGLARSFMGEWTWHSPDVIITIDPNTQTQCTLNNDKKNMGYWLGEYRFGEKTIYPEIERMILALGEPQPYVRVPRTNTATNQPSFDSTTGAYYQSLLAYCSLCDGLGTGGTGTFVDPTQTVPYSPNVGFQVPPED